MTHWYHLQKTKTAAAALALMLVSSSWTSVKAQISLNVSQTTLGAVIQKIQKQSKYQFTYDDNLSKMQVNAVQVKNGKVEDVLNKLLKNKGVSYVIKDGIIYLKKNNLEAYVAIEYKTDQQGYIVKKRVVICDNKKFKKITMEIFNQVKTLKIATTEKIDTIYFQYKIQGSPTLIHSKVDVKIIGYGYNNKSILMK